MTWSSPRWTRWITIALLASTAATSAWAKSPCALSIDQINEYWEKVTLRERDAYLKSLPAARGMSVAQRRALHLEARGIEDANGPDAQRFSARLAALDTWAAAHRHVLSDGATEDAPIRLGSGSRQISLSNGTRVPATHRVVLQPAHGGPAKSIVQVEVLDATGGRVLGAVATPADIPVVLNPRGGAVPTTPPPPTRIRVTYLDSQGATKVSDLDIAEGGELKTVSWPFRYKLDSSSAARGEISGVHTEDGLNAFFPRYPDIAARWPVPPRRYPQTPLEFILAGQTMKVTWVGYLPQLPSAPKILPTHGPPPNLRVKTVFKTQEQLLIFEDRVLKAVEDARAAGGPEVSAGERTLVYVEVQPVDAKRPTQWLEVHLVLNSAGRPYTWFVNQPVRSPPPNSITLAYPKAVAHVPAPPSGPLTTNVDEISSKAVPGPTIVPTIVDTVSDHTTYEGDPASPYPTKASDTRYATTDAGDAAPAASPGTNITDVARSRGRAKVITQADGSLIVKGGKVVLPTVDPITRQPAPGTLVMNVPTVKYKPVDRLAGEKDDAYAYRVAMKAMSGKVERPFDRGGMRVAMKSRDGSSIIKVFTGKDANLVARLIQRELALEDLLVKLAQDCGGCFKVARIDRNPALLRKGIIKQDNAETLMSRKPSGERRKSMPARMFENTTEYFGGLTRAEREARFPRYERYRDVLARVDSAVQAHFESQSGLILGAGTLGGKKIGFDQFKGDNYIVDDSQDWQPILYDW